MSQSRQGTPARLATLPFGLLLHAPVACKSCFLCIAHGDQSRVRMDAFQSTAVIAASNMVTFTDLWLRQTHSYVDGYSGEDTWTHLAKGRVLGRRILSTSREPNTRRYIFTVVVPKLPRTRKMNRKVVRAIEDTLSGSQCRHEHDCCGCWTATASVLGHNGSSFSTLLTYRRNV